MGRSRSTLILVLCAILTFVTGVSAGTSMTKADLDRVRDAIRTQAAGTSSRAKARAEKALAASAEKVDVVARGRGEGAVAGRLAAEFGSTLPALNGLRNATRLSWGEVMIAHTLAANTDFVAVQGIATLRREGMGWGQMAAGLGMDLTSVVNAVNGEMRVAQGSTKADGSVAVIRGEGQRVAAAVRTKTTVDAAGVSSTPAVRGTGTKHRR
jgi:hypothetical protein